RPARRQLRHREWRASRHLAELLAGRGGCPADGIARLRDGPLAKRPGLTASPQRWKAVEHALAGVFATSWPCPRPGGLNDYRDPTAMPIHLRHALESNLGLARSA